MKNYYKILGVAKSAGEDDIKRAYRKLALEYHPDRHSGDDRMFKDISEAYAVLKDPAKRAAHNLDLKKEEVKKKPRTEPTHRTTATSDFGGNADPSSQRGMWDDQQSNDQPFRSARYTAPSRPPTAKEVVGAWIRPVSVALIGFAVLIAIGTYAFRALSGSGSGIPTITPVPSTGNSQGYVPPATGSGYTTPTPSVTPSCPTGQPSITVVEVNDNQSTDSQGRESYTISGTLTNETTATININNVGFYYGSFDKSSPPDKTEVFSDIETSGRVPLRPNETVEWSATENLPIAGSTVTASLEYPPGVGDQLTPEWYFTGSIPQNCQPTPAASN